MKQIIKFALVVLLQVVLTKATPTSPRAVPTDKDTLIEFLGESYQNFLIEQMLQSGLKQVPLLKESIAAVESKKDGDDENITAENIQDLKKEVDGFSETFEQWKADKTNCMLREDVRAKIWNLQHIIEDLLGFEKYNKFVDVNEENYKTEFASLKSRTFAVLADYVKSMPESVPEKLTFEEALEKSDRSFAYAFDKYLGFNEAFTEIAKSSTDTACNNKVTAASDFLDEMTMLELMQYNGPN